MTRPRIPNAHPLRLLRPRLLAGLLLWGGILSATAALEGSATLMAMAAVDPTTLPVESELAQRLRDHVLYLANPSLKGRKPGTAGNRAAAEYLMARFKDMGLEPLPSLDGYEHPLPRNLGPNVVGFRRAGHPTGRWLLIGAHYDHLGDEYLGADDNASAVAILLETARNLSSLVHYPVLFVAFNAEEAPYIRTAEMGSQVFMDHLPPEIGKPEAFQAVVIMDLMGGVHWEPIRQTVFAAGAEKSPGLYGRLKPLLGLPFTPSRLTLHDVAVLPVGMHLVEEIPLLGQVPFSDYDAFRNRQVPHLFLSSGRTPRYHETTDLPDTLHYERMAATVRWLTTLLRRLDQDTQPYAFEPDRLEVADEVSTFRRLATLAARDETAIPDTSFWSMRKLREDADWLAGLDAKTPTADDLSRLERLSIRMQCLLTDLPICFLI
ncbi:MAG: M28 family metallopeptidase [Nitrospirales bacterium]